MGLFQNFVVKTYFCLLIRSYLIEKKCIIAVVLLIISQFTLSCVHKNKGKKTRKRVSILFLVQLFFSLKKLKYSYSEYQCCVQIQLFQQNLYLWQTIISKGMKVILKDFKFC